MAMFTIGSRRLTPARLATGTFSALLFTIFPELDSVYYEELLKNFVSKTSIVDYHIFNFYGFVIGSLARLGVFTYITKFPQESQKLAAANAASFEGQRFKKRWEDSPSHFSKTTLILVKKDK